MEYEYVVRLKGGKERVLMWPRQLVKTEIIPELRVKVTKIVRQATATNAGIGETEPYHGSIPVDALRPWPGDPGTGDPSDSDTSDESQN